MRSILLAAMLCGAAFAQTETDASRLDASYKDLKAAEAKKDPDAIIKYAGETSQLARKMAGSAGADDEGKKQAEYAKQVDTYTEYSLYAAALQSTDPAKTVALVEALERQNPNSQYLGQAYGTYLAALRKAGQNDKAGETAARLADSGKASTDVLLIAADYNMNTKNPEKTIAYSNKLIEALNTETKPDTISDADWTKRKTTMTGVGYWMLGTTYASQSNYAGADKALRSALPNLSDPQMKAGALFYLGLSDYQLGKGAKNKAQLRDALNYSQQAAAVSGPFQTQAAKNVKALKAELGAR